MLMAIDETDKLGFYFLVFPYLDYFYLRAPC